MKNKNKKIKKIYLIGNPNVGKTTVFNALTEGKQKTGNYIGTTISTVTASVQNEKYADFTICDVAGVYNYEDKKGEEKIAWKSIEDAMMDSDAIFVQVINRGQWKQSLSLTLDLQKKGIHPILFFNIRSGDSRIDALGEDFYTKISEEFNLHVFRENVEKRNKKEFQENFFTQMIHGRQRAETNKRKQHIPKTFTTLQEQNAYISAFFPRSKNITNSIKKIDWIDKILLHSFFGILTFFVVMYFVFEITFSLGALPMDWIDTGIASIQGYLTSLLPENLWTSLLLDGVVAGVGGTLMFLPNIIILFFFLSLLRESGYLARTSFLFDVFFQKIGISGRASVPLLMGFGCNVPAVMAIKSFETRKEQIIVAMMSLFMSCGARLPVYALLLSVFLPADYRGIVLFSIYVLGILVSFMTGKLLSMAYKAKQMRKLKSYEMPNLVFPRILTALDDAWQKAKSFVVEKVGDLPNRKDTVIIDEAHRLQGGEVSKKIKAFGDLVKKFKMKKVYKRMNE